MKLTKREEWLMQQAWDESKESGEYHEMGDWLDTNTDKTEASRAVSIIDIENDLVKRAPKHEH